MTHARFADRKDAGRALARLLGHLKAENPVVIGLVRGGLVVAAEVARDLGAPLDLLVARKLGAPDQPELGFGAVAPGGIRVLDGRTVRAAGVTPEQIERVTRQESAELERREALYHARRPRADLAGRTVILVDDGIATGVTMRAAIAAVRATGARRVVVAAGVCSNDTANRLRGQADDVVCALALDGMSSVGAHYDDFRQVDDDEVVATLQGRPNRSHDAVTVSVRFIGSGNAFADGGRSHACILLQAPSTTLLLDCGGSSLPPLKRTIDPDSIDAIAISHLHGDHFGGIPYLIVEQHFKGRTRPLTIAGPRALEERVRAALAALFADFVTEHTIGFPLHFVGYETDPIGLAGTRVQGVPVLHVPAADPYGLRIEIAGRLIAYTGDCRWSDAIPKLARGADLLICEATAFARPEEVHLSYREIEAHRSELECARIVLTHLGSDALAHLGEMTLECASDGMVLNV